jgi:hypothetical protein
MHCATQQQNGDASLLNGSFEDREAACETQAAFFSVDISKKK